MHRNIIKFSLILWLLACSNNASSEDTKSETAIYGFTLLKSNDLDPADTIEYIKSNWFAMDEIAVKRGLLTSYEIYGSFRTDSTDWNVVVIVGYPSKGGYSDIAEEFEKIRKSHKTVSIDGKNKLSEFAKIINSYQIEKQ